MTKKNLKIVHNENAFLCFNKTINMSKVFQYCLKEVILFFESAPDRKCPILMEIKI